MRCPACDHPNPPGVDECERCQTPLSTLDVPTPHGPIERSLLNDPVSVLDPRPPVTVSVEAELGEAIRAMIEERVGALLVTVVLTVPAATVRLFEPGLRAQQVATGLLAAVEGLVAIVIADGFNIGPGPAMAVIGACVYGLAAILSKGARPLYVRRVA